MERAHIFYDGSYFAKVSEFSARLTGYPISHTGLVEVILEFLSKNFGESCYFEVTKRWWVRGVLGPKTTNASRKLLERSHAEKFVTANIVRALPLLLPMNEAVSPPVEKGVDVALALTAYEQAVKKEMEVAVLFTGDSDFVPLIEKLLGEKVRTVVVGLEARQNDQSELCIASRLSTVAKKVLDLRPLLETDRRILYREVTPQELDD